MRYQVSVLTVLLLTSLLYGTSLVLWHEMLGEQELEITVVAGESRKIDFTFDADKDLKASLPGSPLEPVKKPASPPAESSPGR